MHSDGIVADAAVQRADIFGDRKAYGDDADERCADRPLLTLASLRTRRDAI